MLAQLGVSQLLLVFLLFCLFVFLVFKQNVSKDFNEMMYDSCSV